MVDVSNKMFKWTHGKIVRQYSFLRDKSTLALAFITCETLIYLALERNGRKALVKLFLETPMPRDSLELSIYSRPVSLSFSKY